MAHYKKDGSLDMRYSSSKQAASSGFGSGSSGFGSGSGFGSSSYSSYASPSYGGGDTHYKKDGSLDMRYSSSKQAASSHYGPSPSYQTAGYGHSPNYQTAGYGHSPSYQSYPDSDIHLKKDGTMDMRYSSSKQAASSGHGRAARDQRYPDSDIHLKKDGTMDMRYSSSKQAAAQSYGYSDSSPYDVVSGSSLHRKKDGTLDMRYGSSKAAVASNGNLTSAFQKMNMAPSHAQSIPAHIQLKKDGTPDMRTRAAKDWVAQQAAGHRGNDLPGWVPKNKDGFIDMNKVVGRAFLSMQSSPCQPTRQREKYWTDKCLKDDVFKRLVRSQRDQEVYFPEAPEYVYCESLSAREPIYEDDFMSFQMEGRRSRHSQHSSRHPQPSSRHSQQSRMYNIPADIPQVDYNSLVFGTGDSCILGRGGFGEVVKATWGRIPVAVKKLHLALLSKSDIRAFRNELRILNQLGKHENLVLFHGYCLTPPCIVMELVELGNLKHLLHICDKPEVEAKMTDGRIKKIIIFGIVNGMRQLHVAGIVHRDIKPQNILITKEYRAKIADFGLSTLRCKTSATVDSRRLSDDDEEPHLFGGTAPYMAPELLDSSLPPDYPSDVYSFGILLNEVASEVEPYSDQYQRFVGRGPFGAVIYAKQGNRPTINRETTPAKLRNLIERCWSPQPDRRPTFDRIGEEIVDENFTVNDSFSL